MGKGIITTTPSTTRPKGRLVVVIAGDNNYEVGENKWMDYNNRSGETLNVDDTVDITITSASACDVTGKFKASQGTVTPEDKWKVKITTESNDFKVKKDDVLIYDVHSNEDGQYPGPEQMPVIQINDKIEIVITSEQSSVFVKVIEQAQ